MIWYGRANTESDIIFINLFNFYNIYFQTGKLLCGRMKEAYEIFTDQARKKMKALPEPYFETNKTSVTEIWSDLLGKVRLLGEILFACSFGSDR